MIIQCSMHKMAYSAHAVMSVEECVTRVNLNRTMSQIQPWNKPIYVIYFAPVRGFFIVIYMFSNILSTNQKPNAMVQSTYGDSSPPSYSSDVCTCPRPQEQITFPKGGKPVHTGRCTKCRKKIVKEGNVRQFTPNSSLLNGTV